MGRALRRSIVAVVLATLAVVARTPGAETTGAADPFPRFQDIPQELRLPADAKIGVGKDGEYQYNGKARQIIGTCCYSGVEMGLAPTAGYSPELKWLYEKTLDYEGLQRIGFDLSGTCVPTTDWLRKYQPGYNGGFFWKPSEVAASQRVIKESRLPMYVDYTCAPWAHGVAASDKKISPALPEGALNSEGWRGDRNHWMPYSAGHPAGRQIYLDMWKAGAEFYREAGGKPLFYELLNEPAYNDKSDYNRAEFARRMEKKFGGIDKLNAAWGAKFASFAALAQFARETDNRGLFVEWAKFMEDLVAELCAEGVKTIKEIDQDPGVGFCVQPMRWREVPNGNINMYKLSRFLNATSTTTGGGDWLQARFLKSISRGKPIRDGETYMGNSRASFRDILWLQMARGINCSCVFKWDKRAWDKGWQPKGSETGGKAVAEEYPYMLLNPYAVPTDALLGIMDAKREMFKVGDLFFPRHRGFDSQVALLVSFPTERLAAATREANHNFVEQYGQALEYGGFEYDVILEEQMADENRQQEYRAIVAAGVDAIYDATAAKIQEYVQKGGLLILAQEAMGGDEYGKPNAFGKWLGLALGATAGGEGQTVEFRGETFNVKPYKKVTASAEWRTVLAAPGGAPVLLERPVGKGKIVYLAARLGERELLRLNRLLLAERQIAPIVTVTDAAGQPAWGVEAHAARNAQGAGVFLVNATAAPQLVFVDARAAFGKFPQAAEPFSDLGGRRLAPGADGRYTLFLLPGARAALVAGTEKGLVARFGDLPLVGADKAREEGERRLQEELDKRQQAQKGGSVFAMNKALAKPLDLRAQANRSFEDRVAGDGKGGWTDQGANGLRGMEWGAHEWLGVPFEIVRWDHNDDRACIVLKSKHSGNVPMEAKGIEVDEKVKALYFLHACAWGEVGEVMTYVLHHSDGSETRLPVRYEVEIGDWWKPQAKARMTAAPVTVNADGRGLYVWRWENSQPEKTVTTIDVVSANREPIPIVIAITAEIYDPDALIPMPLTQWRANGWGGCRAAQGNDGSLRMTFAEKATDWCGVALEGRGIAIPANKFANGCLRFRINGSDDEWGKHTGGQSLQVKLEGTDAKGKPLSGQSYLPINQYLKGGSVDDAPNTWQEVNLPLQRLGMGDCATITKIIFQYQRLGNPRAGAAIKDLAIVR